MALQNNERGLAPIVLILLVAAVVLVGGAAAWRLTHQTKKSDNKVSEVTPQPTPTPTPKATATPSPSASPTPLPTATPTPVVSDKELITKAVQVYPDTASATSVNIFKIIGSNARGSIGYNEGGGAAFIAHKSGNTWTIIYAGQSLPGKAVGEKYGLPSDWYTTDY